MDPLSILVSTITVLGATIQVSEKVVSLVFHAKNLSNELISVLNDVTDFQSVLTAIEENAAEERRLMALIDADPGPRILALEGIAPAATTAAPDMIQRAHDKLLEIGEHVQRLHNIRDAKGWATLGRVRLLETTRLSKLREELRGMKQNISFFFAVKGRHAIHSEPTGYWHRG